MDPRYQIQRLKILYLARYLMNETNEEHPVSIADMERDLKGYGISAERKALYKDIEALRVFGLDIITVGGKRTRYYIGQRDFELAELKLLADVIASSNFVTQQKSLQLINKLEKLTNRYDAKELHHEFIVSDKPKSGNETIFYSVDSIWQAIDKNKKIRFKYFYYDLYKKKDLKNNGGLFEISPLSLLYEEKNYYLLGYDDKANKLKHYRVDRMLDVTISENKREGAEIYTKEELAGYTKGVFGMYHGDMAKVTLRMTSNFNNVIFDRFGIDTPLQISDDRSHFDVTLPIQVSKQFYGWVFGLGKDVEILSLKWVREELKQICNDVINSNK